jgi:hypothetical protein
MIEALIKSMMPADFDMEKTVAGVQKFAQQLNDTSAACARIESKQDAILALLQRKDNAADRTDHPASGTDLADRDPSSNSGNSGSATHEGNGFRIA